MLKSMFKRNSGGGDGPTILLVGHCGPDAHFLRMVVRRAVEGVTCEFVNDQKALDEKLPTALLALINRVLDGRFSADSGIELIRQLAGSADESTPMMLISNYAEAQQEAETAGAKPGFGKSDAGSEEAAALIESAIGQPDAG